MLAVDFVKFTAQLVLALTLLRLIQAKTADSPVGEALGFILH